MIAMTNVILSGRPQDGNSRKWFGEGGVASVKLRRWSLLYKNAIMVGLRLFLYILPFPLVGFGFEYEGFSFVTLDESRALVYSYNGSVEKLILPSAAVDEYYEWEQDAYGKYHQVLHRDRYDVVGVASIAFSGGTFSDLVMPSSYETIGDDAFCGCARLRKLEIPSTIRRIGARAFQDCNALCEVRIPSSVTNIGSRAFSNCESLSFVSAHLNATNQWGNGERSFESCPNLKKLEVWCTGEGQLLSYPFCCYAQVTNIVWHGKVPDGVCSMALSLESVTIEQGCDKIGNEAFYSCGKLTSINMPKTIRSIGGGAFQWCAAVERIVLPDGLANIDAEAFYGCSSLREIVIPASLKTVGTEDLYWWRNGAFGGCYIEKVYISDLSAWCKIDFGREHWWYEEKVYENGNNPLQGKGSLILNGEKITSLKIPGDISEILSGSFCGCDFDSIVFHSGVRKLGISAFSECQNLTEVIIPDTIESIGEGAFSGCSRLSFFKFPAGLAEIPVCMFDCCESLTDVVLPPGVQRIGDSAFQYCTSLEKIALPTTVREIGSAAFAECFSLAKLPDIGHVTHIDGFAFAECCSVSEIVIPESVTFIDQEAFEYCESVTSLVINAKLPILEEMQFYGCDHLQTLTLPPCDVFLGYDAFGDELYSLQSITFRGHVYYDEWPFAWCDKITDLEICDLAVLGEMPNPTAIRKLVVNKPIEAIAREDISMLRGLREVSLNGEAMVLGRECFAGMAELEDVSISSLSEELGEGCFSDCKNLKSVKLGEGVYELVAAMFKGCVSLHHVELPSVLMVQQEVFFSCSNLEEVTFGGEAVIGNDAFGSCTSLKDVDLSTVSAIMDRSFANCTSLKKLVVPKDLDVFGDGAFECCSGLEELEIDYRETYDRGVSNLFGSTSAVCTVKPKKVKLGLFPNGMSSDCIEDLTVVEGTTAGSERLYTPKSAKMVNLPASLVEANKLAIGGPKFTVAANNPNYAHDGNHSLRSKDGTEMLGWANVSRRWYGGLWGETSLFLREVSKIGDRAFQNCDKLENLCCDSHVTSIGKEAFKGLPKLECVSFGMNLASIGDGAFEDCTKLRIVNPIPKSLKSLGKRAFANCTSTGNYVFEGKPPKASGTNSTQYAFAGAPSFAQCQGEFFQKYYDAWTNKVGKLGQWQGLYWVCIATNTVEYKIGNLTVGMRAICDRLMAESGFVADETSCAVLSDGTTDSDLIKSEILGVEPTITISDNIVRFGVDADLKVDDFQIDAERMIARLKVSVTTKNGRIPAGFSMGGTPVVQVSKSLADGWTDLNGKDDFSVVRVDDHKAVLRTIVDLSGYKFFRAKVD